jgi:hypothetical protein
MVEFCNICNSLILEGNCSNKNCKNKPVVKKKAATRSKKKVEEV